MPPGNRLERLSGNRAGQQSIRINEQYRVCFRWKDGHADDVEITDYHQASFVRVSTILCGAGSWP